MGIGDTILRLSNPAFYQQQMASIDAMYKPMVRVGSVIPMFHFFVFTGVTMYTTKFLSYGHIAAAASREEKAAALAEYREKHGHAGHH